MTSRFSSLLFSLLFVSACGNSDDKNSAADAGDNSGDGGATIDSGVQPGCGDSEISGNEQCDDGNTENGDGCSEQCQVESNFACPAAGEDCVQIVVCGNARIEGDETCDDRNTDDGDGCSAECQVEEGWTCPMAGVACVASECGDGFVAGFEICDDGNNNNEDGCASDCRLEDGYHCPTPDAPCVETTCGDGQVEGTEECDDQNNEVGDGCSPLCTREPDCTDGVCQAVCGDSIKQTDEGCDDGNRISGDGCNADCEIEQGFTCEEVPLDAPPEVILPVTVRDFIASCGTGSRLPESNGAAEAPYGHPDFECFNGALTGMVEDDLDMEGKPVRIENDKTSSDASFAQWYRSDNDFNRTIAQTLTLPRLNTGAYRFDSDSLYPTTGVGFDTVMCGNSPCETLHADGNGAGDQNFHFTTETRWWFDYSGNELLEFSGDDDVWVFINGKLAVDIGGVHGRQDGSVNLGTPSVATDLGLVEGGTYEAVLFHAERHTSRSQYRLTLTNFVQAPSSCDDDCGDGVISSREVCDDGENNGDGDGSEYGGCAANCVLEPYCGDGIVDKEHGEICDDGLNLGGAASACAPGCQELGSRCGDGVVQTENGEQCDDGNEESGDGCSDECKIEHIID